LFVQGQPCLVCKQAPSDAHHLKFVNPEPLAARSATSSRCRFVVPTIRRCTATATRRPGGQTCRYRPFRSRKNCGRSAQYSKRCFQATALRS
jgi:hypothetical protein